MRASLLTLLLVPLVSLAACSSDDPAPDSTDTTTDVDTAEVVDCGGCASGATCCPSRWEGDSPRCVDTTLNPEHCGGCGVVCPSGACLANTCVESPTCDGETCGDGLACSDMGGQGRCCPTGTSFTANISSFFGCCPDTDFCGCKDGQCPISRIEHKHELARVSDDELVRLGDALLATPLYTWRYDDAPSATRFGFLIDEGAPPFAVLPDGERVDLYGYTSLAVAALKRQAARIDALTERLDSLERRLDSLEPKPAR
ncbi:MAG TPA: hypothetical protein PK095_02630 [Myxococcota bacterium]|nr:hypothetical protein [Myxococcota bacterium]